MDAKTEFVFYRDEKNNVFSGGYRINNLFKNLDIPPIYQKGGSNSLVLPLGLFYTRNNQPINEQEVEITQEDGEISDGLFNKLVELSLKDDIKTQIKKNTRKKREFNNKTRKKR